ncbi:MAG: Mov34/MPN/PAD-1 family protein [Candidatus Heimdallarchaeota archaeon]
MQIDKIILSKELLTKLVAHAKKSSPNESVSMISGSVKDGIAYAEKVYTPENIDKSTTTFTVDPLTLLKIYTEIEEEERILVAIYHTHPAPPQPSGTDRHYMEVNPCVWLISSTKKPEEPKGYLLEDNGNLKEVDVSILN